MRDEKIITFDQLYLETALKALNKAGIVVGAARLMGITTRSLFRWKKMYGIERNVITGKFFIKKQDQMISRKIQAIIFILRSRSWYLATRTKKGRLVRDSHGLKPSEGRGIVEDISRELDMVELDEEGHDHLQEVYRIINEEKRDC